MYVDKELRFDDALDVGTTAGSFYSDSAVNLALAGRDVGKGRQMYMVIVVTETFACDTSSTITFHLIEEEDATLDVSSIIVLSTEAFTDSVLTAGRAPIVIPIPPSIALKYLGLKVVTTTDLTAGIVEAFIALEAQTN